MILPSGTITFLFTDIEGSTRLWEEHPDAMRQALARHDALIRASIEGQGGYVFKTMGDAFCAAFSTAPNALRAALAAQQAVHTEIWPSPIRIKVRMALHTGAAEARENDYFGQPLNRLARLLAIGHGGQVLISAATQEMIRDALPPNCSVQSLGEHRLRDLARPEQVFQLLSPSLPSEFPPINSLSNAQQPNNLPIQVTSFVGREKEMAEVKSLLAKVRLLTLTGSGGCGKTRLALQVAAEILEQFPDGVFLVELAPLADPTLVPQEIAQALGIKEAAGKTIQQILSDRLTLKQSLLVLDNCEHLVSSCAHLTSTLLRSCPSLKVLATSREALGVAGEQLYRVPTLSLPSPTQTPDPQNLIEYEAVRLFLDRALLVKPDFAVTDQNAPALAQVCFRLDGIPLAIELAAARVRSMLVEDINVRLVNRFRLLTGGDRTALPRQQTLRALIDWSYDLLNDQEKRLLARLSVFAGGWTLEAAEAVCADTGERAEKQEPRKTGKQEESSLSPSHPGFPSPPLVRGDGITPSPSHIEEWEILDLLTSLVDKSLVIAEEQDGEARYRMLETVRQYAQERLEASGETQQARIRHRDYFLALAVQFSQEGIGAEQHHWLVRLETEHDNLHTALAWCAEEEEGADAELRMACALGVFWAVRGHWSKGREYLERALRREGAHIGASERASALHKAGSLADYQGDFVGARNHFEESLRLVKEAGHQKGIAYTLRSLGIVARSQGDYEAARNRFEESLRLFRELEDKQGIAHALRSLGMIASFQGDYEAARTQLEESLRLHTELGDKVGIAASLNNLGNVARDQGDYAEAQSLYEQSLNLSRELGNKGGVGSSLLFLGILAEAQNDYITVRTYASQSLHLFRELEDKDSTAYALEALAWAFAAQASPTQAACLGGAAEALRQSIGTSLQPHERVEYDQQISQARSALGEEAFTAAWEKGRAMSWEQAVEYALEIADA